MNLTNDDKKTKTMAVVVGIAAVAVVVSAVFTSSMMKKRSYAEIITSEVPAVAIETIKDVLLIKATGLDIIGADVEAIMDEAISKVSNLK